VNFLLGTYKDDFEEVKLIPSSGGVFLVTLNDEVIYSKKETGRFPRNDEIEEKLK
jgi:selenoprotein W-related protein